MDALSDILNSVKLKAVIYRKIIASTPSWGIETAQDSNSQFWRLLKGVCYLRMPGEDPIKLQVGDIVFVPHGASHCISGHPRSSCVPASQYAKALLGGNPLFRGDREETVLIGGHFEIAPSFDHPFINALPKWIHITNTGDEFNAWLINILVFVHEEISHEKAGSKVILGRLADIIFILIIRAYLSQATVEQGFLLALADERISRSLKIMHESPDKDWTLEQLAVKAGMSRSLYSREFKRLVGETPLGYLTNWRILKSKEFLLEKKDNISEVAAKVGYRSEAAFNRLFKSKVGETPANYRRKALSGVS